MKRSVMLLAILAISACGGGSDENGTTPRPPMPEEPMQPASSEVHHGEWSSARNYSDLGWYANPQIDLPRHGRDGLQVQRPSQGGVAFARPEITEALAYRLEPGLDRDPNAVQRLEDAGVVLWVLANRAYLQWTRHLNYDPGALELQIGEIGNLNCGHGSDAIACYNEAVNAVVLSDAWVEQVYDGLWSGNDLTQLAAAQNLFYVLSHEAGHQFHYVNPNGITEGCGPEDRCHAPYGSGSVISYDTLDPNVLRRARYYVTQEDIRHVPNATWNDSNVDRYTVSMSGDPSSINGWGVWIEHHFEVDGWTAPGWPYGGNLSFVDEISGTGWVRGKPSEGVSLTASATWSGEDNFLGVDMNENYLGALLRADANLRYTFGDRPNLNLRVDNFEAHYASNDGVAMWHDHSFPADGFGDFTYNMDCTSGGCSGESVEAKWYADDAGDPSGWVGGVVSDRDNEYAGSFVAGKD